MAQNEADDSQVPFLAVSVDKSAALRCPQRLDVVSAWVQTCRPRAVVAANQELVATIWSAGAENLARQDDEGWVARVIDGLTSDLKKRFPDARGFSPRNLEYIGTFAAGWPEDAIVQAPLAQLPWYHHIALLEKLDSPELRLWYAQTAVDQRWSRNVMVHHIEGQLHHRVGRALINFAQTLPPAEAELDVGSDEEP
ncbi:DUF1016 N-terminal domain-containing protein [Mycobacterium szulgai]|uniref:YhcG N-terminal domain-containing protein n=1 Tax=Mycobacterium szulgai TaxID=1787 RepID=A0A1X2DHW2_MYCSZ|nr:DUF1016 N-terminal domain-containing protein [Mycobacterium szulgai]MCV7078831.1 DUF1016 family protein [Mycobacterium szulgai]ORW87726.1 hypothetical protein AWC27_15190 [Mycobacterium szulgai]